MKAAANFKIEWFMQRAKEGSLETKTTETKNDMYVIKTNPATLLRQETLYHIACKHLHVNKGTNEQEMVDKIYSEFQTIAVKNRAGNPLVYWGKGLSTAPNFDTTSLLKDKDGRCGATPTKAEFSKIDRLAMFPVNVGENGEFIKETEAETEIVPLEIGPVSPLKNAKYMVNSCFPSINNADAYVLRYKQTHTYLNGNYIVIPKEKIVMKKLGKITHFDIALPAGEYQWEVRAMIGKVEQSPSFGSIMAPFNIVPIKYIKIRRSR